MAADRDQVLAWISAEVGQIVSDAQDLASLADRIEAASALDAEAFAAECIDMMRIIGESVRTEPHIKALGDLSSVDDAAAIRAVTVLSTIAMSLGLVRVEWVSRRAARRGRDLLSVLVVEAEAVAADLSPDLHRWIGTLANLAIRAVSERSADMVPVVTVESGVSLPSTVLAYRLYGDATRAASLVDIAEAATPMIMPVRFEALGS